MTSPILQELNPAQRQVVTAASGPLLVIAGAGSGKTRTLVHRVAWLLEQSVPAHQILLLTFTRRAAQEMLERTRRLHPLARQVIGGTFHSLCHRLLRQYAGLLDLPGHFTVLDQGDGEQLLRGIISEQGLKPKADSRFPKAGTVIDLISKSRNLELSLEDTIWQYASHLSAYMEPMEIMARQYTAQKLSQGLLDYDDLLYFTQDLLLSHHELRTELGRRWQHLLVDEYQDTNAVQGRLVSLLAAGSRNLMVVGDDAQSIYRFRGARIENILEFAQEFKDAKVMKLEENYRSTQRILDLANHIIAASRRAFAKKLFSSQGDGQTPRLLRPADEQEQSRLVLGKIDELLSKKVKLRQIAVLFRSAYDSFHLERELGGRGTPFVKVGGLRFLEAAHIKHTLAHLRVLANPHDFVSWQRLLTLLPGVGQARARGMIARLAANPPAYLQSLAREKTTPQLEKLLDLLQYLNQPGLTPLQAASAAVEYYEPLCVEQFEDYPRRMRDLAEIPAMAHGYDDMGQFMAEVVLEPPSSRQPENDDYLTLSTVHSAKGLEWEHVFILWASQGRFPPAPALLDPESMEEERRLMYVACTRAARGLTILAPSQHYSQGQGLHRMALSRFLDDLPGGIVETASSVIHWLPAGRILPAKDRTTQNRPHAVDSLVEHASFGRGKVMGYQGEHKILVHFERLGLKILFLESAGLKTVSGG